MIAGKKVNNSSILIRNWEPSQPQNQLRLHFSHLAALTLLTLTDKATMQILLPPHPDRHHSDLL